MLRLSSSLHNHPILSLRTGTPIAVAMEPIINPHDLKIIGWWCHADGNSQLVLLADDVREISIAGIAVNDEDALSRPDELVRHREILDIHFKLIDKPVKTKSQKLGKVSDYSYNEGLFIQKIYVARSLVKVFSSVDTLIIDREQVLEVTDKHILIRDTDVKVTDEELADASPEAVPA